MKIPSINYNWSVKPLTPRDIYAPQKVANAESGAASAWAGAANATASAASSEASASRQVGRAYEQLGSHIVNASMEIQAARENEAVGKQYTKAQEMMLNTRAFLNRPTIPIDEIPNGIDYRDKETIVNEFGNTVERERTSIPTSEIATQYFQMNLNNAEENAKTNLSERGYEAFTEQLAPQALAYRGQLFNQSAKAEYMQMRDDTSEQARSLFLLGNEQAGVDVINSSTVFTEREKVDGIFKLRMDSAKHRINSVMESNDPARMREYADMLVSNQYNGMIPPDERDKYARQMITRANTLQREELAQQEHAKDRYASELEVAVYRGQDKNGKQVNLDTIDRAFDNDLITGAKRTQLYKEWWKKENETQVKANQVIAVGKSLNTSIPMDPKDKEHQKAVSLYYSTIKESPEQVISLVEKTTIVPKELEQQMSIGAKSDPETMAKSSAFFSAMRERVPNSTSQFDQYTRETLSTMAFLTKNGVDPERAKELIEANQNLTPEEKDTKRAQYDASYDSSEIGEELQELADDSDRFAVDGLFFHNSPDTAPMKAAYAEMRWNYYNLTGSNEAASKMAFEDLSTVWGPSGVNAIVRDKLNMNESEVMFNSPETTYTQLTEDELEMSIQMWADNNGFEREEILLRSDSLTGRSKPAYRSWAVWALDEWGNPAKTGLRYSADFKAISRNKVEQAIIKREGMIPPVEIVRQQKEKKRKIFKQNADALFKNSRDTNDQNKPGNPHF